MELTVPHLMDIDQLVANCNIVSVHKYGFFLCRRGTASIFLGDEVYRLSRNTCAFILLTLLSEYSKKQ